LVSNPKASDIDIDSLLQTTKSTAVEKYELSCVKPNSKPEPLEYTNQCTPSHTDAVEVELHTLHISALNESEHSVSAQNRDRR
jgi:hypothetical protein